MEWAEESSRILLRGDDGKTAAEITFPEAGGTVVIDHTFVDPSLRGQGVAGRLMERTVALLRRSGRKAVPQCSYAAAWSRRHPECADVLLPAPGDAE